MIKHRQRLRRVRSRVRDIRQRALGLIFNVTQDSSGASLLLVGLSISAIIGFGGLATEAASWYLTKRTMQGAADASAFSAGTAQMAGATTSERDTEALTVASGFGFINASGGVNVTVNSPPTSGNYTTNSAAIEVIITEPQGRLLSTLFLSNNPTIAARAVASPGSGPACVLALDRTASGAITAGGTTNASLVGCTMADNSNSSSALSLNGGSIVSADGARIVGNNPGISLSNNATLTTTTPAVTGAGVVADPYSSQTVPSYSGCTHPAPGNVHGTENYPAASGGISIFCTSNIHVSAGGTLNLSNGVFILDRSSLTVDGGATLNVTNATIILTSSTGGSWGNITFNGGATVNATAPTTGATAGLAFYEDRNAPVGASTLNFNGGSTQNITGALYFPTQTLSYSGGASTSGCTPLVADRIAFSGNSTIAINCTGTGVRTASIPSTLVE